MPLARRASSALAALFLAACAGQPFAAPIEDEPVCKDFEFGASRDNMEGALRFPVQVRFLEGSTQLQRVVLHGRRSDAEKLHKSYLPDDNSEIKIEWAQCSNEWAPRAANIRGPHDRDGSETTKYDCGEPTVYKTDSITIKKHNPASHLVKFVNAPQNAGCWMSDAPPPAPKPAASAMPSADPEAAEPAASAEPAMSAAPSASASPNASAAPSASIKAEAPPKPTK